MRLIEEIRRKYPGRARKADEGSPKSSAWLFCVECMGGNLNDAKACTTTECPLHRVRPGQTRPKGVNLAAEPQEADAEDLFTGEEE